PTLVVACQRHGLPALSRNCSEHRRVRHSFPTRRSSDLDADTEGAGADGELIPVEVGVIPIGDVASIYVGQREGIFEEHGINLTLDRKSTRLNSSHVSLSYAVFCLKKKKRLERDASLGDY